MYGRLVAIPESDMGLVQLETVAGNFIVNKSSKIHFVKRVTVENLLMSIA